MYRYITRALVSAAFVCFAGTAFSADLPVKAAPIAPESTPLLATNGFYTVLGGSVLLPGSAAIKDRNCSSPDSLIPCGLNTAVDGSVGWFAGGAFGKKFSPWFRADVSLGYGEDAANGTRLPVPPGVFPSSFHGRFSSFGGYVTGYIDIAGLLPPGQLGRFEPFVGAGVGLFRVRLSDIYFSNAGVPGVQFNLPGGESTKAAFQLVAGTGYRLNQHWALQVAYAYADLGHVQSPAGIVTSTPATFAPFPTNGIDLRARSHRVDLGVRYDF